MLDIDGAVHHMSCVNLDNKLRSPGLYVLRHVRKSYCNTCFLNVRTFQCESFLYHLNVYDPLSLQDENLIIIVQPTRNIVFFYRNLFCTQPVYAVINHHEEFCRV